MFSFFKRNKSKPTPNNNTNNDVKSQNAKLSLNMQSAIERQQASLQQNLEQRRKNDVNDRQQNDVNSHSAKPANNVEDRVINRSSTMPSVVSESDKSSELTNGTCALQKHQNYDQYRDAKRSSYFRNDSSEHNRLIGSTANTPINYNSLSNGQTSPILPPTVVTSPIRDQKCLTIAGTSSSNASNSVYEAMGRGRYRNKHRTSAPNIPQNNNRNNVKNHKSDEELVSKNFNDSGEVTSENSNVDLKNVDCEQSPEPQNLNSAASADEISQKFASISSENVFHEENSSSIISQPEYRNDNIAPSDDEQKTAVNEATNNVSTHVEEDENLVESVVASSVKNDEHVQQQVGAPLQRNPSARRVTFAPSPPRSLASSLSDDETEETLSEDVFYEATEAQSETQKLRILSTITSHSNDCSRVDEETSEVDDSTSNGESSSLSVTSNDLVCAKIILSVDESKKNQFSDNEDDETDKIKNNAFSGDETSFSSEVESAPKTIKPSYLLVGHETIALPDIVAETSLYEQHNHATADEMADLGSPANSFHGSSTGNNNNNSNHHNGPHKKVEIDQMQVKVNDMCMKIDELERQLDFKCNTIERLQSELESANKEGECVRQRLRFQDAQLEKVKERQDLAADEEQEKYVSLEQQYRETVVKLQKMQSLASNLNVQLAQASHDTERIRQERDEILDKLTAQEKLLRDILQTATEEREQIVAKWKHDFEQLRNVNSEREEHLMEDCEWKLRQMMKQCKEKIEKAEKEKLSLKDQAQLDRQTIRSQREEIKNLKDYEREVNQLRGFTTEQKDSIAFMLRRIDDLKSELNSVKRRLQDEIDSCSQIKRDCAYQLSEKERSTKNRIDIARGEAAIEWEDRLMAEMCRLTLELEQVHLDERNSALNKLKAEHLAETKALTAKFKEIEQMLLDQIATLKAEIELKMEDLRDTQSKSDLQLLESRAYLDKKERDHQKEVDRLQLDIERQLRLHSDLIEEIRAEHKREREQIKASFYRSLEQIKEEFANEITLTTETLQTKHKREMDVQWKQLVQEKEAALVSAENRHRIKLEDADNKLSALKLMHQRQLNDVKAQFDHEKSRIDNRDVSNAQEIDTLHRKCICLTKLFEEMRMRYERRDPRPEDLRQIDELKSVVDSQEKDIFDLTEQLRAMQLQLQQQQQQQMPNHLNQQNANQSKRNKNKHNKNTASNRNGLIHNENSNNNAQQQQAAEPQETKQNANHEQPRMKPPLIKTIIYEEENENELYEEQIREERENAKKNQDEAFEAELHSQQNGVTVEFVPESPDYTTKNKHMEEFSEAHIVADHINIPDVVVIPHTPTSEDKLQEIRIEVISTIEPAHIQVVSGGNSHLDLELD